MTANEHPHRREVPCESVKADLTLADCTIDGIRQPRTFSGKVYTVWACGSEGERLTGSRENVLKLLYKLPLSKLATLSNLSPAYISQVRTGKRPPSQRLIESLINSPYHKKPDRDYLRLFLESRMAMGVSPKTMVFYQDRLWQFAARLDYAKTSSQQIERYLNTIPPNQHGLATRHASYRALRAFYSWLHFQYGLDDPMARVSAPILGKPIM